MTHEKDGVDYSQFWTRFKKPNGQLSGATFDDHGFASLFGEEAARAFDDYRQFTNSTNPPTTPEKRQMYEHAKKCTAKDWDRP